MRIVTEETQLATLRERMDATSTVEAPAGGRVLELLRTPGQLLREGDPILTIDVSDGTGATPAGERLKVQAFVHPGPGRTIREGMDAYVAPSFVRRDEFGLLVGRIAKVSRFPASPEGMQSVLGNPETVRALTSGGAPFAVTIELLSPDSGAAPGGAREYRWTSRHGPGIALRSGTLCDVSVVVRRRRPVELLLPFLGRSGNDAGGARP
jgi:HlyD family secretion protein